MGAVRRTAWLVILLVAPDEEGTRKGEKVEICIRSVSPGIIHHGLLLTVKSPETKQSIGL